MVIAAVALLRGVNVGGRHKIAMQELRDICCQLGAADARTLLQSGNVVLRVSERTLAAFARRLEDAIELRLGFRPAVLLRTSEELAAAAAGCPFAGQSGIDPARLAVLFLAAEPRPAARVAVAALSCDSEIVRMGKREVYVYFRDGMARPKVTAVMIEKAAGCQATGRNWNTVTKLLGLTTATAAGG